MNISPNEILSFLPTCLLISLIFSFTPYLTRRSEAFGVSIPAAQYNNPTLVSLRRRYRNLGLIIGAVLLAVLFCLYWTDIAFLLSNILMIIQLVIYFLLYLWFHKQTKELKAAQNWTEHTTTTIAVDISPAGKSYISPAWLLLFPLIMVLTAILGVVLYPAAPDRIVTHWSMAGVANAWTDKSYGVVWFALVQQLFMSALMCFVFYITKNARRQIDADNIEESSKRVNLFRKAWGYYIIIMGVFLNLTFVLTLASMLGALDARVMSMVLIAGFVLILAGACWLVVTVGQGGSRIKLPRKGGGYISVRDDDRYWKLGTIYYNPEDPAVFVEKRFGIGWTCNFARPMSWVFLIELFAVLLILIGIREILQK